MHILATAGHVDHGKSALVATLTGTHPDRLKEEQIREMTTDLGFAFFNTSNGNEIGIIDVPGHIDFIDNMLAGMGGIDGVLLIIAADEGIMPQTREHLAILDLLEITQGIVVITKIDLVTNSDWLELIENEIRTEIDVTSLKNSPIVRVSTKTGQGFEELKIQIEKFVNNRPQRIHKGNPRLPIDRVFTIHGFGTVVTGTLLGGPFENGDEIEILPEKIKSRIRSLQVHNVKIQKSFPGSRTAVNLINVNKEDIKRGSVLTKPGTYSSTSRIDVSIRLLPMEGLSLKHNDHLNFFTGTAHRSARVRLLGSTSLSGGESGYLQLELDEPLCVERGDHYILRKVSPSVTVGGGEILETNPSGRYKLRDAAKIKGLELTFKGSLSDLILVETGLPVTVKMLVTKINRDSDDVITELKSMISKGIVVNLSESSLVKDNIFIISSIALKEIHQKIGILIQKLHNEFPLRKGFLLPEISKNLRMEEFGLGKILDHMVSNGILQNDGKEYRLSGNLMRLSPLQEKNKKIMWAMIDDNPFTPPTYLESSLLLGKDLLQGLIKNGELIQASEGIIFRKKEFDLMVEFVKDELNIGQAVTVTGVRNRFSTSRKYALPFLEHLDRIKITRRVGDEHVKFQ